MRVAVLAGGRSSEHEVSLQSGASVRDGLAEAGHEVLWVELRRDGTWWHDGEEIAAVARAAGCSAPTSSSRSCTAPFGEDGTVQGLLELLDVAYVGLGRAGQRGCAWTRSSSSS